MSFLLSQAHDFLHPEGKVSLFCDKVPTRTHSDSFILSSFLTCPSCRNLASPLPLLHCSPVAQGVWQVGMEIQVCLKISDYFQLMYLFMGMFATVS